MLSSNLKAFANEWGRVERGRTIQQLKRPASGPVSATTWLWKPGQVHPVSWFVKWAHQDKLNAFQSPLYTRNFTITQYIDKDCKDKIQSLVLQRPPVSINILIVFKEGLCLGGARSSYTQNHYLFFFGDSTLIWRNPHLIRPIRFSFLRFENWHEWQQGQRRAVSQSFWGQPFAETVCPHTAIITDLGGLCYWPSKTWISCFPFDPQSYSLSLWETSWYD